MYYSVFIYADTSQVCRESELEDEGHTTQYTKESFVEETKRKNNFLIFYAPWSSHCQKLGPTSKQFAATWEELANSLRNNDSVSISKIGCPQHRAVCGQFDIKGYPTFLWTEDGKEVDKFTGQRSHEELKAYVSMLLGKNAEEAVEETENSENTVQTVLTLTGNSSRDFFFKSSSNAVFVSFNFSSSIHCI